MQANPKFSKPVSQLKPIPIVSTWDRIGIDLIGPLPIIYTCANGNKYNTFKGAAETACQKWGGAQCS